MKNISKVGMAWASRKDEEGSLPCYRFILSVAAVNQAKVDGMGNINVLVKRLTEPDRNTQATHQLYIHETNEQVFDESSELLISVNRKKVKDCFLLNGFFHLEAYPNMPKSIYKKLHAYTYQVKEDQTYISSGKKPDTSRILGYAYLKVQADIEQSNEIIGKMFSITENAAIVHHLFIKKDQALDLAGIESDIFYVIARKAEDTTNEFLLFFSSILNYQETDFVFLFHRKDFMRLGWSDNNGHLFFTAHTHEQPDIKAGDLVLDYVHYNPENLIRANSAFPSAQGWSRANMSWLEGDER
ncbi:MAG: hypothetical protein GVY19_02010 [Bacteroidetes bacterium]|nr:hypothetical protein [Bacteroidota bacterium]